ncbi:sigma-54-dependent transcriptional regulator [Methylosarcina fibrata]|uniref:sigma-54-dependent transcriptional regulator n=1 Tax=Methylosarcina fibrata TaxID=105972 RepID=UPI0003A3C43F|nr:sigma-54 dependent transcriptional regulator [Methylosarcina fibrata]
MPFILIVDDDVDSAMALKHIIAKEGFVVAAAANLAQARAEIEKRMPDVILTDLMLPDGKGLEIFGEEPAPANVQMILMTGFASLETSVEALRLGFKDYLTKPVSLQRMKNILAKIPRTGDLKDEIDQLRKELRNLGRFGKLWGTSKPMQEVYDQIAKVAPSIASVMIIGESGTGKEAVAQTIHDLSTRRKNPFLPINCSAISPQLIESELFGHERGSFTGATKDRKGYFEQASGGTLFLDEVTEMPIEMQAKLLRVLETGAFLPVGGNTLVQTDVRIISATNRDPMEAVEEGKLREDLLYRLQVFPLCLPPLRDRKGDVDILASFFLEDLCRSEKKKKTLTPDAYEKMNSYHWPGNVRELKNALHRAYIMADDEITAECILDACPLPVGAKSKRGREITAGMTISEMENRLIDVTLEYCSGNKEAAAEMLGISVKTLYNKLKARPDNPSVPG